MLQDCYSFKFKAKVLSHSNQFFPFYQINLLSSFKELKDDVNGGMSGANFIAKDVRPSMFRDCYPF